MSEFTIVDEHKHTCGEMGFLRQFLTVFDCFGCYPDARYFFLFKYNTFLQTIFLAIL